MREEHQTTVFFDGDCGLCTGMTGFALRRIHKKNRGVCFAPIGGVTFGRVLTDDQIARLPDSLVVAQGTGEILFRYRAVLRVLKEMGGGYRAVWVLAWLLPRPVGDVVYRGVAALRKLFSARVHSRCVVLPPGAARMMLP